MIVFQDKDLPNFPNKLILLKKLNAIVPSDFFLEVSKGNVPGHTPVLLAGRNPSVATQFEDLWEMGVFRTLAYDGQTGNFTVNQTITGGTSNATATIVLDEDDGSTGTLTITNVSGVFVNDETITDEGSGSATTNGTPAKIKSIVYPTVGETWEVICQNANDTLAGTGARTILVTYLNDAFVEKIESKNLNGQTAVTFTATDGFRFRSAAVTSWGSATSGIYGKTNLGSIFIRDSSTKNLRSVIFFDDEISGDEHGLNNSLDLHYTVPAGKTLLTERVTVNTVKDNDITIRALQRLFGLDGFYTIAEMAIYQDTFPDDLTVPPSFPEKTDLKFIAKSNNTTADVNIEYLAVLVNNALVNL